MRRFNSGWYGESHRHYLASKNIKTKYDFSARKEYPNLYVTEATPEIPAVGESTEDRAKKIEAQIAVSENEYAQMEWDAKRMKLLHPVASIRSVIQEREEELADQEEVARLQAQYDDLVAQHKERAYMSPIIEKTGVPVIDFPEEYNSIREKSIVKMSPDEFLRLTKKQAEQGKESDSSVTAEKYKDMSQEDYEKQIQEYHKMNSIRDALNEGKDVPMGYLEFSHDLSKRAPVEHEGRHRAMVARELGMKEIPVALVRGRELIKDKNMGHWKYEPEELAAETQTKHGRKVIPFRKYAKKEILSKDAYEEKWMDKLNINQRTPEVRWRAGQERLKDLSENEKD